MADRQASVTHYYSALSTDELLFILSTKELTADAKESLERELKGRGVNDLELQVSEVRKEQEQFAEYERIGKGPGTPRQFFWSMVMWLGIGLVLAAVSDSFYGRSVAYWLFLSGLFVFAVGLWMLRRLGVSIAAASERTKYICLSAVVLGAYAVLAAIVSVKVAGADQLSIWTKLGVWTLFWWFMGYAFFLFRRHYRQRWPNDA